MAEVTFTPEEIATFPQGPQGEQGEPGPPGPKGDPGVGGSGALPAGFLDVTEHGLVDDASTDNTAALQAMVDAVSLTGEGRYACFVFPRKLTGRYKFMSTVNVGPRPIHFVGQGFSYNTPVHMTTFIAGTNGQSVLDTTFSSAVYQQGPRISNIMFNGANVTGATGIKVVGVNRLALTDVVFLGCSVGLSMVESTTDCAWHVLRNVAFVDCATGLLSTSSNNWFAYALTVLRCGVGLDLMNASSSNSIFGITLHPSANGSFGIRINGSGNAVYGAMFEAGNASAGPRIAVQVNGDGTSAKGSGNTIQVASAHGGSGAGNQNVAVDLTSGTTDNRVDIGWQSGFDGQPPFRNAGLRNRINGGAFVGPATSRPAGTKLYAGVLYLATDTGVLSIPNGTAWKTVGTVS